MQTQTVLVATPTKLDIAHDKVKFLVNFFNFIKTNLAVNPISALGSIAISGLVKEIQKLLADAQKELDKFTQNKIDSDINDMFDE